MRIAISVLLVLSFLGLASCSDDFYNQGLGSGSIDAVISVDTTLSATGSVAVPDGILRAPAPSEFKIFVTDSDGNASLWSNDTPSGMVQRLIPGVYTVSAVAGNPGSEGFDTPCFYADTTVIVADGTPTLVPLTARLANTLVAIDFDPSMAEAFSSYSATVHSRGGHYCGYSPDNDGPLFLRPGDITVSLDITMPDGRSAAFNILEIPSARASAFCHVEISASSLLSVPWVAARASSGQMASVALTGDFLDAPAPTVIPSGFSSDTPLILDEGATPPEPLMASVVSADLRNLYLTAIAPTLGSAFAAEIDLLNLSPAQADSLSRYGIDFCGISQGHVDGGTVDFTRVVTHLRYVPDAIPSTFSLQAVDATGHVSQPIVLAVDLRPVDLSLVSVSRAIIGLNRAQMVVASSSPSLDGNLVVQAFDATSQKWSDLEITSIEPENGSNRWIVTFCVPDGLENVNARILYCGDERESFSVGRESPAYTLAVDPFALHARIAVTADSPDMTGIVTSAIQFYDDKGVRLPLVERTPADGTIILSGLDPDKAYTLHSSLIPDPSPTDFGASASFRTESATHLPNGDFEDIKFRAILYKDMLSGGRYSQNTVEIYNRQNRTSFEHHLPEAWATVNSKTFNRAATNHNTWYMAPSTYSVTDAYSGAYAVRLDCVGYSLDGPPIPDYCQTSQPYTDYSLNTPSSYSKAAGRLFLGAYSFAPRTGIESYNEGMRFASRPSALNGFYRFVASPANINANALARIEILGNPDGAEIVIASGEIHLSAAMSYTAFTIPLSYSRFGEKATSIRVMFAASDNMGDIESENRSIVVTPLPASATLRGSSLWIDNLSLSY